MIGYQYYECNKKKGTMYMCVTTDIKIKSSSCQRNVWPFGIKTKFWPPKKKSNHAPLNYVKSTHADMDSKTACM